MKEAFDKASVMKTLKNGIDKGYWTIEDLDKPTQFSEYNFKARKKALIASLGTNFEEGLHMPKHTNLLREISEESVHVEIINPRDYLPPAKDA